MNRTLVNVKMKEFLKKIVPEPVIRFRHNWLKNQEYKLWVKSGKPLPPHAIAKQKTLLEYKGKYNLSVLIETGTCYGGTIEALRNKFKKLISIEISPYLFSVVKEKFKKYPHIDLFEGDSGELLPNILKNINEPCLFWLDGHYSGDETGKGEFDTPIYKELDAIYATKYKHVIIIDDARLFVGKNDYPTISELTAYVYNKNPQALVAVEMDLIRIVNP